MAKTIAYIIAESAITGFENTNIIAEDKAGRIVAEGVLQRANELNRNGRYYSSDQLFPQLTSPRIQELLEAGYLRAELGHPLSNELVRQQLIDDARTCAQFLKLWTNGDEVWGRFRGTNNAFGEAFNADLKDGCKPAWSLRALGNIERTDKGNEVRNLKIITWDQVIYPSHPSAYTRRVLSESANANIERDTTKTNLQSIVEASMDIFGDHEQIIPISKAEVLSFIKNESDNFKWLKETFDFLYEDAEINTAMNQATFKTVTGEKVVVNLEQHIQGQILNYASNNAKFLSNE